MAFLVPKSSGILNIDILNTELILGGKEISKSHVCYFHDRRRNIYYRHGISLPSVLAKRKLWQFPEEKNLKHME